MRRVVRHSVGCARSELLVFVVGHLQKSLHVVAYLQQDAPMGNAETELLQGTLDLLILKALSTASLHGWDISKRIAVVSEDRLKLKQGSLYPALHKLEGRGWIESEWGVSEAGRRAKFYKLTTLGRKQLAVDRANWESFAAAMANVLNMEEL